MGRIYNTDIVGNKVSKLVNFLVGGTPTVTQEIGYDVATKRLTQFDGTVVQQIAHMEDIIENRSFQGVIATAVFPTIANLSAVAKNTTITKGDEWIYSLSASANLPSAPAYGNIKVSTGDKVLALINGASTPAHFAVIQSNLDDAAFAKVESFTVTLVANTPSTVTLASSPTVTPSVQTRLSTGEQVEIDTSATSGSTTVSLTSNVAVTVIATVTYK